MTTFKIGLVIVACLVIPNMHVRAQTSVCFKFRDPIQEAQCLLKSDRAPIILPRNFKSLLGESVHESDLGDWRSGLNNYLQYSSYMGTGEAHIGGPSEDRIRARYFVIHSVTLRPSSTLSEEKSDSRTLHQHEVSADGGNIDINALRASGLFHVYTFWNGRSVTVADFSDVRRSLYLAMSDGDPMSRQIFTHVGVVLTSNSPSSTISFTEAQAKTLALVYIAASVRAQRWLIPAFHSSLEPAFMDYEIEADSLRLWDDEIGKLVQVFDSMSFSRYAAEYAKYLNISERKVEKIKDQLTLIRRRLPDRTVIEGYNANEVKRVFTSHKTELLEGLNNEEFAGIRAYINRYYPSPESLPTFQVNSGSYPYELNYTGVGHPPTLIQDPIILVTAVDNSLKTIRSIFSTLQKNKQTIDFEVTSTPSGATVTLKADGGKSRTADTNSRITNFFRGIYTYRVTKEGFKTITREINLMHERGTRLECTFANDSCVVR